MSCRSILIRTTPYLLIELAMFGSFACSDFGNEVEIGATADGTVVSITNFTKEVVYYSVFGRQLAARINWAPCRSPECRQRILPGQTLRVINANIPMESGENEVLVFWWKLTMVEDGECTYEPMHVIVVHL